MKINERINHLLHQKDMSIRTLSTKTGIPLSSLARYLRTGDSISVDNMFKIAHALGVTPWQLTIGTDIDTPMSEIEVIPQKNIFMVPVYESASAGYGTDAIDTVVEYSPAYCQSKAEADETMVIRVRGNSMAPKIEDGDMLQVWRTPYAESGSICVVTVDTDHGQDGFVKRIRYGTGYVELQSLNDGYDPVRFTGADAAKLKIVGVVRRITKIC